MKKLEAYKAFSVVAWSTVVLFTFFTYNLTRDLQQSMENLQVVSSERTFLSSDRAEKP